jgi:hypothetical protein
MITILGEGKTVKYIGFTKKYLVVQCDCGAVWQAEKNNLKTIKQCRACFLKNAVGNLKHGKRRLPEYRVWATAKARCNNLNDKKYQDYGNRGIKFCEEWNDFEKFITDMGRRPSPKHSIGRINNDGDYCKENCRWETATEQARNKRNTIIIEIEGIKKPLAFWCELFNKDYKKVYRKSYHGMDMITALTSGNHGRNSGASAAT